MLLDDQLSSLPYRANHTGGALLAAEQRARWLERLASAPEYERLAGERVLACHGWLALATVVPLAVLDPMLALCGLPVLVALQLGLGPLLARREAQRLRGATTEWASRGPVEGWHVDYTVWLNRRRAQHAAALSLALPFMALACSLLTRWLAEERWLYPVMLLGNLGLAFPWLVVYQQQLEPFFERRDSARPPWPSLGIWLLALLAAGLGQLSGMFHGGCVLASSVLGLVAVHCLAARRV